MRKQSVIHENPSYDREDTQLKVIYFPRNVPFITGQSQAKITTINTHACAVWEMKFHENSWYESQDTDKEVLGSRCKAGFLIDQSQPNLHFVSVRVQSAIRIFRKIALLAAEIQTKWYYVLHVNCPSFFLTVCNQAYSH